MSRPFAVPRVPAPARPGKRPLPGALGAALLAVTLVLAFAVGLGLAWDLRLSAGMVAVLCCAPVIALHVRLGLMLVLFLSFVEALPILSVGPEAAGGLVVLGWVGALSTRGWRVAAWADPLVGPLLLAVLLVAWTCLSAVWAADSQRALEVLWQWGGVLALFVIVSTSVRRVGHLELVALTFVAGGVASVLAGLLFADATTAGAVDAAAESGTSTSAILDEGRLYGGVGDPNALAAAVLAASAFAVALFTTTRGSLRRWVIVAGMAVLAFGLFATQSRGGFIAAIVAAAAALAWSRGNRRGLLGGFVVLLCGLALFFALTPRALERVQQQDRGGGRADIWRVAWRVGADHPVLGVGVNNHAVAAPLYLRQPGALENVDLIVGQQLAVHNTYLELWAETGLIGLVLFLALAASCVSAGLRSARRFDRQRDPRAAALARGVAVATIAVLATSFFLSNGTDKRLWFLLALGPALLVLAQRAERHSSWS